MIKTLIFDFGDVFINLDKSGAMQNALDLFGLKNFDADMIAINTYMKLDKFQLPNLLTFTR